VEEITLEEFKKLDLRIALVKKVEPHPNADRLYVITIDTGAEEKSIVAGIKNYYKPEELVNRKIVIINNLQKSLIRGVESSGMLLASKDSAGLAILVPDKDVATGSVVS